MNHNNIAGRRTFMKRPHVYSATGIIILVLLVFSQPAMPQIQGGNLIFIFDASGSMWGQVQGTAKIQIAKDVLTGLVRDLPEGINVGLMAYGHRKKGDCNDVEELVPLGVLDKDKIINKIQAINPKGKTPITLSVKKTAEKLKNIEEETTIILVSDGKETCAGDPCALVRQLKESGVKFIMHVIGFDVTAVEKEQLECMAKAGGGLYYEAKNAGELKTAAKKMVEESGKWGFFKVTTLKNNKPFKPWIEISHDGQKKPFWNGPAETKKGKPGERTFKLKPGAYDIRVIDTKIPQKPAISFTGIQVAEGKTVEKTADFTDGILKATSLMNGKPFNTPVELYKPDGKMYCTHWTSNGVRKFNLPPGTYTVKVINYSVPPIKPAETFAGVEIKAGQTVEINADFAVGFLKVTASKNGKPFNTPVELYKPDGKKYYTHWTSNGVRIFNLLPGTYKVKVLDIKVKSNVKTFNDIQVQGGKTESIEVSF
jgi:Ca-activated chloride channel family protein